MVDEAKAFCPGCGHAFVEEEKREEESKFNQMDGTMQFGQTMYNQMLSDMGLNVSSQPTKAAEPVQPATQVIKPAVPETRPVQQILRPAVEQAAQEAVPTTAGVNKWLIAGIAVVILIFLIIAAAIVGVLLWSRFA